MAKTLEKMLEEMSLHEIWEQYETVADHLAFSSSQVENLKRRGEDTSLEYEKAVEHLNKLKSAMSALEHVLGLD